MKKILLLLLAMVMLIGVPCLAFDGYEGHEGQIPFCQNNKTGAVKVASTKDIDPTTGVNYEPHCNTRFMYGTTIPTETLIWVDIHGSQPAAPNPLQVALLRWYGANTAGNSFPVGNFPVGVAFDGASIWVTNYGDATVTKLRANDGSNLGTFPVGNSPNGVVF
ncbi:MAG: YncE family protein, partial [Syntrophales bacterium]